MSTPHGSTDSATTPPPPPPAAPQGRVLRRSRTDRVGAGVAGGLGQYLGLDPVLFRVLFAVSAFFGGAGVLAYVLAWAAIPDEGTQHAAVDGWVAALRRRNVPFWVVAVVVGIVLWCVAFSWWAPGPFFPVLVVVVLLVVLFGRRGDVATPPTADPLVDLTKPGTAPTVGPGARGGDEGAGAIGTDWVSSARAWITESQQASRERRRRAFPVRIATLLSLVLTLIGLGIADAATGIALPLYFWCAGAILLAGLLTGLVLRRTPWSMAPLLVPALAGMIAFGATHASLHDGVGQRDWVPTTLSSGHHNYGLAFGQGTLDLRRLAAPAGPAHLEVTMGAGQVRVLLPADLNVTVVGHVHIGEIQVDGRDVAETVPRKREVPPGRAIHRTGGYDISHTVSPPDGATGAPITVVVRLADGQLTVHHPA